MPELMKDTELWPDERLLELMQESNHAAFDQIYNKYWSKLYLAAYNILRDRQASEDAVQEVLVSLWMKRNSLSIDSLAAFLHASVRYQVFKVIRLGKVKQTTTLELDLRFVENEAEDSLNGKDINHLLDLGVARLPQKCQEIYHLSRNENMSTKQIAMQLGLAPKTVENQLTIALRRLRTTLGNFIIWAGLLLFY